MMKDSADLTNIEEKEIIDSTNAGGGMSACGTSNATSSATSKNSNRKRIKGSPYKYAYHLKEDHNQPIFGAQFHQDVKNKNIFASVGSNRVSIYECLPSGQILLIQAYSDPDAQEVYYTCAWSNEFDANQKRCPIVAVAGLRAVIRIISLDTQTCIKHFIGHGQSINELKFHPTLPYLLMSASKDHSLRLWNTTTGVCVAIFGGAEGHRDQVLGVDFHLKGEKFISCGMDHSLKLWRLDKPEINKAMKNSTTANANAGGFKPFKEHFPEFTTRDIHENYIDCALWFGNLIISKSCEDCIVCWKIGEIIKKKYSKATIIHRFPLKNSGIWNLRFCINMLRRIMAAGTQNGKTVIWEFNSDINLTKTWTLSHKQCISSIRQTTFSSDGQILICVCDDGTIWRWDKKD